MPRISIIIPVYKVEKYLRRCLDSILSQTYADFEALLIDDGTSDSCAQMCDEYSALDDRIMVIHQKNGGISKARNAGLDWVYSCSQSKWITFVDSDDWIHPDYLLELIDAAEQSGFDLSMCRFLRTNNKCEQHDTTKTQWKSYLPEKALLWENNSMAAYAWGRLYSRELFSNYRFPIGMVMEDFYLIPEIMINSKEIAFIEKNLYYYYENPTSILHHMSMKIYVDSWLAYEKQIDIFENTHNNHLKRMQINNLIIHVYSGYNFALNNGYTDAELKMIGHYGRTLIKKYFRYFDLGLLDVKEAVFFFIFRNEFTKKIMSLERSGGEKNILFAVIKRGKSKLWKRSLK